MSDATTNEVGSAWMRLVDTPMGLPQSVLDDFGRKIKAIKIASDKRKGIVSLLRSELDRFRHEDRPLSCAEFVRCVDLLLQSLEG